MDLSDSRVIVFSIRNYLLWHGHAPKLIRRGVDEAHRNSSLCTIARERLLLSSQRPSRLRRLVHWRKLFPLWRIGLW